MEKQKTIEWLIGGIMLEVQKTALERIVYRNLALSVPELKEQAREIFGSSEYAARQDVYRAVRIQVLEAVRRNDLNAVAEALGQLSGELGLGNFEDQHSENPL
jgi:hypothetical protein